MPLHVKLIINPLQETTELKSTRRCHSIPYQRRFAKNPPKKVEKKEELVFTPFAPFLCLVLEVDVALPFLADGPTDRDFEEAFAFLMLVVVLANAFRGVRACEGAC